MKSRFVLFIFILIFGIFSFAAKTNSISELVFLRNYFCEKTFDDYCSNYLGSNKKIDSYISKDLISITKKSILYSSMIVAAGNINLNDNERLILSNKIEIVRESIIDEISASDKALSFFKGYVESFDKNSDICRDFNFVENIFFRDAWDSYKEAGQAIGGGVGAAIVAPVGGVGGVVGGIVGGIIGGVIGEIIDGCEHGSAGGGEVPPPVIDHHDDYGMPIYRNN